MNADVPTVDSLCFDPSDDKIAFRLARTAVGSNVISDEQDKINAQKAIDRPEMVEALNLEVCALLEVFVQ